MVRTSKGPAEHSKPDKGVAQPLTTDDRKMERNLDLDDETWDRIESMARSQSIEPAEVVRRAITQSFGAAPTVTGYHSGTEQE